MDNVEKPPPMVEIKQGGGYFDNFMPKAVSDYSYHYQKENERREAKPKSLFETARDKIWKWGTNKLKKKLFGGDLTPLDNQDHQEIKNITGKYYNNLILP